MIKLNFCGFLWFFFFLISTSGRGQQVHAMNESHEQEFKHHRLSLIVGHGHVIGAETEEGARLITIPTWGFNYDYWINHQLGVALKSDIEILNYLVEDRGQKIERKNPLIVSAVFLYKTSSGLSLLTGPGIEFEKNENFFIYRIGAAFEFEVGKQWDFSPEFIFDLKDLSIGSFTLGIGVGLRF